MRSVTELFPCVIIHFTNGESNLVFHKSQLDELGGYRNFIKDFSISIKDIKKVVKKNLKFNELPTAEWPC